MFCQQEFCHFQLTHSWGEFLTYSKNSQVIVRMKVLLYVISIVYMRVPVSVTVPLSVAECGCMGVCVLYVGAVGCMYTCL